MDVEVFEFNKGDNISIKSASGKKPTLGKIEEIQPATRTFSFSHYYRPEDTHHGRMDHHGMREIFKTNEMKKADLDSIERKIQVMKMKEYLEKRNDLKDEEIFVVRQYYDFRTHAFAPEYNKCFCQKLINLDDEEIILCACETAFHENCIIDDSVNCPYCGKQLKDENYYANSLKRKRNNDDLDFIPLKKVNTGYNFANAKTYLITQKPSKPLSAAPKLTPLQETSKPPSISRQTNERKEFAKISEMRYKKLQHLIEKYKQNNSSKNIMGVEKSRYNGKENIFTYLMYGYFEMQEIHEKSGEVQEEEKKLMGSTETQIYDYVKKLAIEIEATIFMEHNKNNKFKISQEYVNRFRVLLGNLKDDANYELRSKILTGQMTPQILSKIDEKELTNSQKRKEIIEKEQKYLQAHILDENEKLVAKTHKGEIFIEKEPEIPQKYPEKEVENTVENNNGLGLSKSKSELSNGDDESETSLHDPADKIKKNQSLSLDLETESRHLPKNNEKEVLPTSKFIDLELWKVLLPFVNDKKKTIFLERMKKSLPEKEANYLIDRFLKK